MKKLLLLLCLALPAAGQTVSGTFSGSIIGDPYQPTLPQRWVALEQSEVVNTNQDTVVMPLVGRIATVKTVKASGGDYSTVTACVAAAFAAGGGWDCVVDNYTDTGFETVLAGTTLTIGGSNACAGGGVVVRPSGTSLPAEFTRVTGSTGMWRLRETGNATALTISQSTQCLRLVGMEVLFDTGATQITNGIVAGTAGETNAANVPSKVVLDRIYLHSTGGIGVTNIVHGVDWNASYTALDSSLIVGTFDTVGNQAQGFFTTNGPGPQRVTNNHIQDAGQCWIFGGGDPGVSGLITTDIEIRRNLCDAPTLNTAGAATITNFALTTNVVTITANNTYQSGQIVNIVGLTNSFSCSGSNPTNGVHTLASANSTTFTFACTHANVTSVADSGTSYYYGRVNIAEIKEGERWLQDGNTFADDFPDVQSASGVPFTVRNQGGTCSQCGDRDGTFTNNIVKRTANALGLTGYDDVHPSQGTLRLYIANNLVYQTQDSRGTCATYSVSCGVMFRVLKNGTVTNPPKAPEYVTLDHNTVITNSALTGYGFILNATSSDTFGNWKITNNVSNGPVWGGGGTGNSTLNKYSPLTFDYNDLIGETAANYNSYTGHNLFTASTTAMSFVNFTNCNTDVSPLTNCALQASSPGHNAASDGADMGANMSSISTAQTRQTYPH